MIKMAYNKRIHLMIVCFILALAVGLITSAGGFSIGVCYGMEADNLPPPKEVVSLYKSHHIGRMRLYEPNHKILHFLQGSGIEVLLGIKNYEIQYLATSSSAAVHWVNENINPYWPNVQFRYIAVGNEVIPGPIAHNVLEAMLNLNKALVKASLSQHIRVSTVVSTDVMHLISENPSLASFSNDSYKYMFPIVKFLEENNAPLLANIYPFLSHLSNPFPNSLLFALFLPSTTIIKDGNFEYQNSFDIIVDAFHTSMEKVGVFNVPIVIAETGWPSTGFSFIATPHVAKTYYENVIRHISSSRGTPRHPRIIETYLYSLFNENKKSRFKRYCGLFNLDLNPLYHIGLSKFERH